MSDTKPKTKILRVKTVCGRVGDVNPSTIWRWEQDPKIAFPKRIKIGPNVSGWVEDEVDRWIAQRSAR